MENRKKGCKKGIIPKRKPVNKGIKTSQKLTTLTERQGSNILPIAFNTEPATINRIAVRTADLSINSNHVSYTLAY